MSVILFTGGRWSMYDVTSCLAVWSHVPSWWGVSISGPMFLPGGLCLGLPDRNSSWTENPRHRPLDRDPQTETPLDREPPGQRPPGQRPPWTETPLDRKPPGQRTPNRDLLDREPSPGQRPPYGKEREVCILLECILVF